VPGQQEYQQERPRHEHRVLEISCPLPRHCHTFLISFFLFPSTEGGARLPLLRAYSLPSSLPQPGGMACLPFTARVITRCMKLSNGYPAHHPPHLLRGRAAGLAFTARVIIR